MPRPRPFFARPWVQRVGFVGSLASIVALVAYFWPKPGSRFWAWVIQVPMWHLAVFLLALIALYVWPICLLVFLARWSRRLRAAQTVLDDQKRVGLEPDRAALESSRLAMNTARTALDDEKQQWQAGRDRWIDSFNKEKADAAHLAAEARAPWEKLSAQKTEDETLRGDDVCPTLRSIEQNGTAIVVEIVLRNKNEAAVTIRNARLAWVQTGGDGIVTAALPFLKTETIPAGRNGTLRDTFELCRRLVLSDDVSVYLEFEYSAHGVVWKKWGNTLDDVEVRK